MNCKEFEQLQHAYLDQELDPANAHAFALHIAECPACAKQCDALSAVSKAVKSKSTRHAMPPDLYDTIVRMTSLKTTDKPSSKQWRPLKWGTAGAGLAMAACLAFLMVVRPNEQYLIEQQLIDSHIRSLQEGHLTDVISTDQHTVKPWFNGRLDVSPPVIDLVSEGFPLIGGRLDYIDHHSVATIVYHYNKHIINLFIWPSHELNFGLGSTAEQQGYNMRHWQVGDLQFWAVSDVNPAKLAEFEILYRGQNPKIK